MVVVVGGGGVKDLERAHFLDGFHRVRRRLLRPKQVPLRREELNRAPLAPARQTLRVR